MHDELDTLVRDALAAETARARIDTDAEWDRFQCRRSRRPVALAAVGVAAALVAAVAGVVALSDDDETGQVDTVGNAPTSTSATSDTTTDTTATTGAPPDTTATTVPGPTTATPGPTSADPGGTVAPTTAAVEPRQPDPVSGTVYAVADGTILGWWDGADWVLPARNDVDVPPIVGETLRPAGGGDPVDVATAPQSGCFPEEERGTWFFEAATTGLFVSGTHDVDVRPVTDLAPAAPYEDAVRRVLESDGVDAEVEIDRVLSFDVEGDGVNEVLIEANRIEHSLHDLGPGNYSILLLRRIGAGGVVEEIVLHADTRPPPPEDADSLTVYEFVGLADVNGDGTLELATRYYGYEWGGVELWDIRGEPTVVLRSGCGV